MSAFDKVIGYEDIKAELVRFCDVLKNPEKYEKLGVTLPRGILLAGEPGLGKTLMATSFIEESGRKSFVIRKDKPDGDFISDIKRVFEEAKKEPYSIVLLDDMDKYANEDEKHRNAEEYVAIQACIDDSKDYKLFVLATINDDSCLPDSLKRPGRFDKTIEFEVCRGEDSRKIIEYYLSQKKITDNIDVEEIDRLMECHTCVELESVINEAGIYAGFDNRDSINQDDFRRACMRVIHNYPESVKPRKNEFMRNVAVHEVGHALTSEILTPGSVNLITISHDEYVVGGKTLYHGNNACMHLMTARENRIISTLGGKAATEIVFGTADLGCGEDMSHALVEVDRLVDDVCAYGFDTCSFRSDSNFILERIERRCADKMIELYAKAKKLIIENREFFDALVEELLEKETLTYKDIAEIRARVQN